MIEYTTNANTKAIQRYSLEILTAFHDICEAHQLRYILDFGTLLGAVRHEGFIPWDDDIDVAMTRTEFEQFQKVAAEALPPEMFLQTHQSDPNYYSHIAKIRMVNEAYVEKAMQYLDIVHGPWLDIFIYDYKFDDKEKESEKQRLYTKYRSYYPQMMERLVAEPSTRYPSLEMLPQKMLRWVLKKSQANSKRGLFMQYLDKKYEKLDQLIKNAPEKNKSGDMITYTFPIRSESDEKALRLNESDFQNRKLHPFENSSFYIPVAYDEVLTHRYGDYLQLPPLDERKSNHHWAD